MIIKCKNCGNDVSDNAEFCPHCNTIIRTKNKISSKLKILIYAIWIIGIIISFTFTGIYFSNSSAKTVIATGFLSIVILAVGIIITWLSTVLLEAVAEGLQLLEDIKNKL